MEQKMGEEEEDEEIKFDKIGEIDTTFDHI